MSACGVSQRHRRSRRFAYTAAPEPTVASSHEASLTRKLDVQRSPTAMPTHPIRMVRSAFRVGLRH
jgi:hypothetical protein